MFLPLFLPVLILLSLLFLLKRRTLQREKLPPGPYQWPIIGNLLQIGKKPHVELANMAQTHGQLISLRLGFQLVIIATSPTAASQIFKTQDRVLSARYVPQVAHIKNYRNFSLIWSLQCDENWRKLRTIFRVELLSPKLLDAQTQLRQPKASEMMDFLSGKKGEAVRIGELVFATIFNLLGNLVFSTDVLDLENGDGSSALKNHIWRMMELGAAPNLADFFPLISALDIQGLKRESTACVKRIYDIFDVFVRERREEGNELKEDFLNVLISAGFSDFQIKSILLDMFVAATDTSTVTVEWAMAELIKNPETMSKARVEIDSVLGDQRKPENAIKESQLMDLTYLHACIKETLRLHPPAPLLLPHRAAETCEVMDYTIPKDCQVIVNVWAIGRDPKTWPDPLSFSPDRFLGSNLDYKGNDFKFIPFSAGRRICPGMSLSIRTVGLILASLIHSFDWCLPNGLQPAQLNMDEKFGLTLQKEQPLVLVPKLRAL